MTQRRQFLKTVGAATASIGAVPSIALGQQSESVVALRGTYQTPVPVETISQARDNLLTGIGAESTDSMSPQWGYIVPETGDEYEIISYNLTISKEGVPVEQYGVSNRESVANITRKADKTLEKYREGISVESGSSSTTSSKTVTTSSTDDWSDWTTIAHSSEIRGSCPEGEIEHEWTLKQDPNDGSTDYDTFAVQTQNYVMPGSNPNICDSGYNNKNAGIRHRWDYSSNIWDPYLDDLRPAGTNTGEMTSKSFEISADSTGTVSSSVSFTYTQPDVTVEDISSKPEFAEWEMRVSDNTSADTSNVSMNPASLATVQVPSTNGEYKLLETYAYANWETWNTTSYMDSRTSLYVQYGPY